MKILVLSHMYPSSVDATYGIFVEQQIEALIAEGCEIEVVAPVRRTPFPLDRLNPRLGAFARLPHREVRDGLTVHHPRWNVLPRGLIYQTAGALMRRAIRRTVAEIRDRFPFDVIHAHTALPDGRAAIALGAELGVPVVVTIHGADILKHQLNATCRRQIAETLSNADRAIFVSDRLRRLALERMGPDVDGLVVGNGVALSHVHEGTRPRSVADDRHTIFSASHLIETKAIRYNILALADLLKMRDDVRYVIAGEGPEEALLRKLVQELGIADHVEFAGTLPHDRTMEMMASADVYSMPSWNEGFGVVYIEAMSQGTPVIAGRGEGIADVVTHGETGLLVEPRNVEELVEAFRLLLDDPEEAHAIGERGRRLVSERYTWERNARTMRAVFDEIVAERRGRPSA